MEQELFRRSVVGAATVVPQALKRSHVVKRDRSRSAGLSGPSPTSGHEF